MNSLKWIMLTFIPIIAVAQQTGINPSGPCGGTDYICSKDVLISQLVDQVDILNKQVNRLTVTTQELKDRNLELTTKIELKTDANRIAFTAGIRNPVRTLGQLQYDSVPINLGMGLNQTTGEFVCPTKGIYWISFWALSISGIARTTRIDIQVNGVARMYGHSGAPRNENENANNEYMLGNAGLVQLEVKDKVSVKLNQGQLFGAYPDGTQNGDATSTYNQFSGYLVYSL